MLIDTFLYFNEEELVELRLKYLNNIVDYFVVIEADVTHQGNKKGWNFPKILNNQLKSYSNKIQYHQVNIDLEESKKSFGWIDENTKGGQSWKIENIAKSFGLNVASIDDDPLTIYKTINSLKKNYLH